VVRTPSHGFVKSGNVADAVRLDGGKRLDVLNPEEMLDMVPGHGTGGQCGQN